MLKRTWKKWGIFLITIGLIAVSYRLVGLGTLSRSFDRSLLIPMDGWIPFIPVTVLVYLTIYFFWLPPIFSKNVSVRQYGKIISAAALAFTITFLVHLIMPAAAPRATISETAGLSWAEKIVKYLYAHDLPSNTFPSSHVVAAVTLMIMAAEHFPKRKQIAYSSWGALISLSTLTVKQHYVVDVIGAVAVALFSCWLVKRFWKNEPAND